MADSLFNLNTGDSSSASYSNAQYSNQASVDSATVNADYQHDWLRTPRPFGLNVRVPETPLVGENTEALIKKTAADLIMAPVKEISDFLEKYSKVFSGETASELKSLYVQRFNTVAILNNEDEEVLGSSKPTFVMDM